MAEQKNIEEAMDRFAEVFDSVQNYSEADTLFSLYELGQWFEGIGYYLSGKEISDGLRKRNIEMSYCGSMYLYTLKNKPQINLTKV